MANRIEPPVLVSRLMTFMFASSLVILAVLLLTLYNMFPLNRPQVFLLYNQPRSDREISLVDINAIQNKEDVFLRNFVREYIKARNEKVINIGSMQSKWNNSKSGIVRAWSSDKVYNDFTQTAMWNAIMNEMPDFEFECPVEFTGRINKFSGNTYEAKFRYYCKDSNGQTEPKSYTVHVTLDKNYQATSKWTDRLNNPLGVHVTEYKIIEGDDDPLNWFYGSQTGKEIE